MATKKDYYDVLGVSKGASADEIKKAYRNMAREHHPDMVAKEDKEAAEIRFKEINEAYQVLSDSEKRKMYDQFGHTNFNNSSGPFGGGAQGGQWGPFSYTYSSSGGGMDFDPFDIFEDVFGFRGFGGGRVRKGKNLYYELHVDFSEAVRGAEKVVEVESGKITIKIPQGARDGTELRFSGKGMPGPSGAPAGDLFISLRVRTPAGFQRVGDDFVTAISVDFITASLGDIVEVSVIDPKSATGVGKAKVKIPAGTQPGTQINLRGQGMPKLRGSGRGNVVVQIFVNIPRKLNRKQKQLLEEYKNS